MNKYCLRGRYKRIQMLKGKKIVLGVTGSIAAYKAAMLLRLLVKEGAEDNNISLVRDMFGQVAIILKIELAHKPLLNIVDVFSHVAFLDKRFALG